MGQQGTVLTRTAKEGESWRTPVRTASCSGRAQLRIELE